MRHLLARLLCILAAVSILDGQSILLQSWAWATMLNDRIPEQGLSEAISSTFDGAHPCERCLRIARAKQKQSDSALSAIPPQYRALYYTAADLLSLPSQPAGNLARHFRLSPLPPISAPRSVPTPPPQQVV